MGGTGSTSASNVGKGLVAGTGELAVEEVVRPGKELRPLFEALDLQYDGLYTAAVRVVPHALVHHGAILIYSMCVHGWVGSEGC